MMPFYVDNTQLSAVQTCEMKAGLRYVLGLTTGEERLELDAGTACHVALAAWHQGRSKYDALAEFEKMYRPLTTHVSAEERLSYQNVHRCLDRFFSFYEQNPMPYTPQKGLVEVVFEAPLDANGDFQMVGRIDLIAAYKQRLVVFENKTTGGLNDFWKRRWPMTSQLTTYVFGAQEGYVNGKRLGLPIEEALVLGIELRKIPESTRKCPEHKLPYSECGMMHIKWEYSGPHPRPTGFIERWRRDALEAAMKFKSITEQVHTVQDAADKLQQNGQFNDSCRYCEFNDSCRQGVPADLMTANLLKSPWNPHDVKHTELIQLSKTHATPSTHQASLVDVTTGSAPVPSNAKRGE